MSDMGDQSEDVVMSLRSRKMMSTYLEAMRTGNVRKLTDMPSLREWKYWRLITNDFPYDTAFKTHHMLVIKRLGVGERFDLTDAERQEFDEILKDYVYPNYNLWFENAPSVRTVLNQYHVHLAVYHDTRADMQL